MTVLMNRFARSISVLMVAILLLSLCPHNAWADSYPPSHNCDKPDKPYKFTSERQLQEFKDEVERYKRCIEDFVDEQNNEAENHRRAAQDAIDEWNLYVRYELN